MQARFWRALGCGVALTTLIGVAQFIVLWIGGEPTSSGGAHPPALSPSAAEVANLAGFYLLLAGIASAAFYYYGRRSDRQKL